MSNFHIVCVNSRAVNYFHRAHKRGKSIGEERSATEKTEGITIFPVSD